MLGYLLPARKLWNSVVDYGSAGGLFSFSVGCIMVGVIYACAVLLFFVPPVGLGIIQKNKCLYFLAGIHIRRRIKTTD